MFGIDWGLFGIGFGIGTVIMVVKEVWEWIR
jgi:hypothetical protein